MRAADQAAIAAGTSEHALMERAGRELAAVILSLYAPRRVVVLAGSGNNGNDGRIAAKHLMDAGFKASVFTPEEPYVESLSEAELVVDALLGTGLNKPVSAAYANAIEAMNACACPVIAVDIPSGIDATTGAVMGVAVKATHTVTFAAAKLGHYLLPGKAHTGTLHVMDIGIDARHITAQHPRIFLNTKPALPEPSLFDHKYSRGHALVQGGTLASAGAAKLTAQAALKVGAGAVSVLCDSTTLPIYAASFQAVMTKSPPTLDAYAKLIADPRVNALAIGMGAGVNDTTLKRATLMLESGKPCVVDADALQPDILPLLHERCIITPHMGEYEHLYGIQPNKLAAIDHATSNTRAVVVLKGNDTMIAQAGKPSIVNHNAPPTLATAGSGDVLAGIIAGLLAQGMKPFEAACAGVYLHGAAASALGRFITAEDVVSSLSPSML